MIFKRQTEIIPFGEFMAKKRTKAKPGIVVPALFPVITPHHLFPVQDPECEFFEEALEHMMYR